MCDLNLKITEMQKLVDSLEDGHVKTEMLCILTDIRLLQKSELQSEMAWETGMMALVGTDGLGGVKRIVNKMLTTFESFTYMPSDSLAIMAPKKSQEILDLIGAEKYAAHKPYRTEKHQ